MKSSILSSVVSCALAAGFLGCGAPARTVAPRSAPKHVGSVELVLHEPTGRPSPLDRCDIRLCQSLVELIDGAKTSIDFAVYGVRGQTDVLAALRRAKARGVRLRGVVDRDVSGRNYYKNTEDMIRIVGEVRSDQQVDVDDAKAEAERPKREIKAKCKAPDGLGGPVQCLAYPLKDGTCLVAAHATDDMPGKDGAIMHNKFFVADRRKVWTGSTNVSDSCAGGYNANLVVVVDDPQVGEWYAREVDQMWEGRYHRRKTSQQPMMVTVGDAKLHVLFSPQDSPVRNAVRPLLRQAKRRIDIAVFYLTDKGITADLIAAKQRGVDVRVVLDSTAAVNGYTKHELLRAVGIPVKVENWGGKMHMKSAAVDGRWVVAGSMNWTTAGQSTNDENTIIIKSARIAKQYHEFFDRMWTGLGDRWLTGHPRAEGRESQTACTDGVDNDFDRLADDKDPGCSATPPPMAPLPGWRVVPMRNGVCDVDDPETLKRNEPTEGAK